MGLKHVLEMTPEELARAEWRGIHHTLREMQVRLEADGTRQTWCDWVVTLAAERGKEPEAEATVATST